MSAANGIYIEWLDLCRWLERICEDTEMDFDFFYSEAAEIPSAVARPVVHGRWERLHGDSRFMCSVCKGKENVPTIMGEPTVWDFCPNCGALMEGDS